MPRFEMETVLPVSPEELSRDLLVMSGVNRELSPFLKMTAPKKWAEKPIIEWPVKRELFSSVILLFGLIPIDLHRFKLFEVDEHGFKETSKSLFNRLWSHERTILKTDTGASVKDVVYYESKAGELGALFEPIYRSVFVHRHKKLKQKYIKRV